MKPDIEGMRQDRGRALKKLRDHEEYIKRIDDELKRAKCPDYWFLLNFVPISGRPSDEQRRWNQICHRLIRFTLQYEHERTGKPIINRDKPDSDLCGAMAEQLGRTREAIIKSYYKGKL